MDALAEAAECLDWYRARWEIEMFFDILKNNCKVRYCDSRVRPKLEIALAMFMFVAWRINRLLQLDRQQPDLDAALIIDTETEILRKAGEATLRLGIFESSAAIR